MSRDDAPGFDEFVAVRSHRLLRTCYLLTHDHALAEDLLQTALAKAWFAWGRIEGDPEPYVRASTRTSPRPRPPPRSASPSAR